MTQPALQPRTAFLTEAVFRAGYEDLVASGGFFRHGAADLEREYLAGLVQLHRPGLLKRMSGVRDSLAFILPYAVSRRRHGCGDEETPPAVALGLLEDWEIDALNVIYGALYYGDAEVDEPLMMAFIGLDDQHSRGPNAGLMFQVAASIHCLRNAARDSERPFRIRRLTRADGLDEGGQARSPAWNALAILSVFATGAETVWGEAM